MTPTPQICIGKKTPLAGVVVALGALLGGMEVSGQFIFTETFKGTSAPGWEFAQDGSGTSPGPRLTADTAPVSADPEFGGATIDAAGDGWLRLTTVTGNQANAVALDTPIPSSNNIVQIEFEYTMWRPTTAAPADGLTVFLWDAATAFDPGAFGGSLGYANRTGIDGLGGAYLGVGLDTYGNFSNATEGRNGGVGFLDNEIVLRGPGSGQTGYEYLAGTGGQNFTVVGNPGITSLNETTENLVFSNQAVRPDQDAGDYRAFRMTLDGSDQLTVEAKFGFSSSFETLFVADMSSYTRPDLLRIGFAGSTGGLQQVTELRGLEITATTGGNSFFWDNEAGNTLWTGATNWDQDTVPADYATVLFTDGFAGTQTPQTVSVNSTDKTQSALIFSGDTSYTLNGDTGSRKITLEFDSDGSDATDKVYVSVLNNPNGNADHTLNVDLDLGDTAVIQNLVDQTLTVSGDVAMGTNALELRNTGTTVMSGILSGTGTLTKTEAGTARLTGNNTYSGLTTVSGGTLQIENDNALGATTGATVVQSGGTLALAGNITTPVAEAIDIAGTGDAGVGAISNTSGTNTWRGDVDLTAAATIGAEAGTITFSGDNTVDAAGFALTLKPEAGATIDFDGQIFDSAGTSALIKNGAGTAILSVANDYAGDTTVNAGTLRIEDGGALGDTAGSTIVNSGGTLEVAGGITVPGGEDLTVAGAGVAGKAALWAASGVNEIDAPVAVDAGGASFGAAGGATLALDGAISGTGTVTVTGSGITQWAAPMSYTGATVIESGTLQYRDGSDRIVDSVPVTVNSGATYDLANFNDTIGSLAGAGNVALGSGDLTAGGNDSTTTFSGVMSGTGDFTKQGTGTMTFSGTNTFTGDLNVNGGEVVLGADNAFANGMDLVMNGGKFTTNGFSDTMGAFNQNSGASTVDFNSTSGGLLTFADAIYGAGSLTVEDWTGTPGTSAAASTTTGFFVTAGSIDAEMTELAGATTFAGWGAADWKPVTGGYELVPNLSGFGEWDGSNNNTWGSGGGDRSNWVGDPATAPGFAEGSKAIFGNLDTGDRLVQIDNDSGGVRTLGNMILSSTNDGNYTVQSFQNGNTQDITFNQTGTADAFLVVSGNGSHQIGGNNRPVDINLSDDLRIVNNSTDATGITIGFGTGTGEDIETNGNDITVSGSSGTVINSLITETGAVVKNGTGVLTLNNANTYSGGTTLNDGTLALGNNAGAGTGTLTINGGTIQASGGSRTVTNTLAIGGSFTVAGDTGVGGTEDFIFSGTQTVTLPASGFALTVDSSAKAIFDTDKDLTGTGGLAKEGTGALEIRSNDTDFSGTLAVNAGTVLVNQTDALTLGADDAGNNYLGTGSITVASGATLTATMAGNNAINLRGGDSLTNNGGTVTLSNTNTGTGADFNLGNGTESGSLVNTAGTMTVTVGDDFVVEDSAAITVSGGTMNLNPGATFVTQGGASTPATINVSGGGALNVDLSATGTGDGNAFTLGANDAITVDGAATTMNITAEAGTTVAFNGDVNLTNQANLTVTNGTTSLPAGSVLNGGNAATAGTLTIVNGSLSVDEPLVSNRPNLTMDTDSAQSITAPNAGSSISGLGTLTVDGTGSVTINANISNLGANTLLLEGGTLISGANNQIDNSTDLALAGGTWNTAGFDETLNSLTLTATSSLDLGTGNSVIQFGDSAAQSWVSGQTLYIDNWSGDRFNGGGTDQVLFASAGLTSGQINQIVFRNPAGLAPGNYGAIWLGNEIVPVPEPGAILGASLLVLLAAWRERKRMQSWIRPRE